MSKTSSTQSVSYPAFAGGELDINGEKRASTGFSGGNVVSNYNMTDAEKRLYDYSQNALAYAVPQMNTFLPEAWNSINKQLDAYSAQGAKTIDKMYSPLLSNLKNDIASRFGNFDNSMFMDNLNSLESKRSDAMGAFASDVSSKRSSLIDDELNRRYNYVNLLNLFQNQPMQNALAFTNSSRANSQLGNSYNQALYNAMLNGNNGANLAGILNGVSQLSSYFL